MNKINLLLGILLSFAVIFISCEYNEEVLEPEQTELEQRRYGPGHHNDLTGTDNCYIASVWAKKECISPNAQHDRPLRLPPAEYGSAMWELEQIDPLVRYKSTSHAGCEDIIRRIIEHNSEWDLECIKTACSPIPCE